MTRKSFYFLTGIALAGVLVGIVFLLRLSQPQAPTGRGAFARAQGPRDAPVQIIEYSDFECQACQAATPVLYQLLADYPGKIRLVHQHFPLEGHRWSFIAHQASECAAEQGKFWRYHDVLYAAQSDWSKSGAAPIETFIRYAQEMGLSLDLFSRCLSDAAVTEKIRQEKLAGSEVGIRSTPSFFVNGTLVVGVQGLREKVEESLGEI